MTRHKTAAVLVAAGTGTRFTGTRFTGTRFTGTRFGADLPKQFQLIAGQAVLRHAAISLAAAVDLLQPVGDAAGIEAALDGIPHLPVVPGGDTRQGSVRAGLDALAGYAPDRVLIHDGARPHIPAGLIDTLWAALETHPGAIPAVPVADTLKRGIGGVIAATVPRESLFRAQTPQAFHFAVLHDLHARLPGGATDDASLLEAAGMPVALVPGSEDNIKLTYPEDLVRLERILTPVHHPRVGIGYDVHVLAPGRKLVLCGVEVPHDLGLDGHSDADVGIHALCDAIYGALAEGDIGRHFPPSQAQWKDADSARFLRHAAERIAARGGRLLNADVTLICEKPKISPHAAAMMARLAGLLGVDASRISVKATTTERLGFTGRMEGIAAQAVASILMPDV